MKKILLLVVCGLLIACLAGSAMAGDIGFPDLTPDRTIILKPTGSSVDVKMVLSGMADLNSNHIAGISSESDAKNAQLDVSIVGLPGSKSTNVAHVNEPDESVIYIPGKVSFEATLHVTGNCPGTIYIYDNDLIHPKKSIRVFVSTDVPEFPTIAAPVAGVLGLLFVIGRKRGNL